MLTVFSVLWLVVLIGNAIILFVERFVPVTESKPQETRGRSGDISSEKIAAIVTAVQTLTAGRGRVAKIERKQ
jgi:oxaloacetate decarboxylase gamma subunit